GLAGQLMDQLAEAVAARLVVAELIEARAGGGEQHDVSRDRRDDGAPHGLAEHFAALDRYVRLEDFGEPRPRLADRVGGGDIAEVGRTFVEVVALRQAAANPVDALVRRRRPGSERGRGRVRVGGLT